ncbi:MAG TPA: hypothetical protein ENH12_03270 [Proteobacteria bacterium]|nr:hypothetical protein [Pseudomonadota bacterium]
MSRIIVSIIVVGFLLFAIQPAQAQYRYNPAPPVQQAPGAVGKLDVNFSSEYIWRGVELNHQFVMQPSARISESGFELEAIGNMDLSSSNDNRGKFTRWIYRAGLAKRSQEGSAAISYIYYDNKHLGFAKTQEIALEIQYGYPFFGGGDVYYDFDNADGFYLRSVMGYVGEIGPLNIIPKLTLGYASSHYQDYYFGVHDTSILDVVASLKAEFNIVSGLYIYMEGDYYELAKSALRHSEENIQQGENFYWQGGVDFRF